MPNITKKMLIIICSVMALLVIIPITIGFINKTIAEKDTSKIKKIIIENDISYKPGQKISAKDFNITAEKESKKTITIKDFDYSPKKTNNYGKTTPVTITVKDPNGGILTQTYKLKNRRGKTLIFKIGRKNKSDAQAILYSNGELHFTGKGAVMRFSENNIPWKTYDISEYGTITAVTFDSKIKPVDMDDWFSGMEDLQYVGKLPASIESLNNTFSQCPNLKKGPEWQHCTKLTALDHTFADSIKLKKIQKFPTNLIVADNMCTNCVALTEVPDMSHNEKLTSMKETFTGCQSLMHVDLPPNVEDLNRTFQGCLNLKDMPEIPESTLFMNATFENNLSLQNLTILPKNVLDVTNCFTGCSKIRGDLWVDANPKDYNGCFANTAQSTIVNLDGNSDFLNQLALTSVESQLDVFKSNILVQSKQPVEVEAEN